MLTIGIDPVAFSIGALEMRWYGIMVAVGVLALLVITFRELKRRGIPEGTIYNLLFLGIIGGIIGAKLVHLIQAWSIYGIDPSEIISPYGWALHGVVIGVVLTGLIYWRIRARETSFQDLLGMGDAVAVGAPLAQAFGRIGCTMNGCCHGKLSPFSSFPGAVSYTPRDAISPQFWNTPVYPTQIYFLLWNLIVFAVVWRLRNRLKPNGSLFFVYLSIYCAGDFGLRFLRADSPILVGLQEGQIISLAILMIVLPVLIIRMREFSKNAGTGPANETGFPQNQQG